MKKVAIASFSLLAIMLLSMMPFMGSFGIKSAEASYQVPIQWGHLAAKYNETEKYWEEYICYSINWLFEEDYSSDYYAWNAYWDNTTDDYVEACMEIQNDPGYDVDFVTNW